MASIKRKKKEDDNSASGKKLKVYTVAGVATGMINFMRGDGESYSFTTEKVKNRTDFAKINWTLERGEDQYVLCTYRQSQGVGMAGEAYLTPLSYDIKAIMKSVAVAVKKAVKIVNDAEKPSQHSKVKVKVKTRLQSLDETSAATRINGKKYEGVDWVKITFKVPYTVTMEAGSLFDLSELDTVSSDTGYKEQ